MPDFIELVDLILGYQIAVCLLLQAAVDCPWGADNRLVFGKNATGT
jgi:hypothetical protein